MPFNPDIHHRRTIRMRSYDYATCGAYFVTMCTKGRVRLFGDIRDGIVRHFVPGIMVKNVITEMPAHYSCVDIDVSIVMPDHVHMVIWLAPVGAGPRACPPEGAGPRACPPEKEGHPRGGAPTTLGDVVHRFKSLTTARYRHGVLYENWPPFNGRLWQRNYWERIIRDDEELNVLREYILTNPVR